MRARLLYTFAGTALLSVLFLLLLAGGGVAQTDPPASGDWTVADTTVVVDQTVDLHGDLVVTSTGSLTLRNVTLNVHLNNNGEHGIEVQTGGTMVVEDGDFDASTVLDASKVMAQPSSRSYHWMVRTGSTLRISNSFVYNCGYTGTTGNTRLGLFLATDDVQIEGTVIDDCLNGLILDHASVHVVDSHIGNCTYHGVEAQDSDIWLTRVNLAKNGYNGVRLVRGTAVIDGCWIGDNRDGLQVRTGANLTMNGSTVKGNSDGLLIQIDGNVVVTDCVFKDQTHNGIQAENRGVLVIARTQISDAARTGLYVLNDISVTSTGNVYSSNVYGVHLNMQCSMTSTMDTFSTNTNSGIYLESTSQVVLDGGTLTRNSAGVTAEDGSTVVAWDTTIDMCPFEGFNMVDSDLEINDGSILNCTGGGVVVDATSTSLLVVNDGNASSVVNADLTVTRDYLVHGDLRLEGIAVYFRVAQGAPVTHGFLCDGGTQVWTDTTIRPETTGDGFVLRIDDPASGTASGVTMYGLKGEWPLVNAPFEFMGCTFRNSEVGLAIADDRVVVTECAFTNNGLGVDVVGVKVRFENCTFSFNSVNDVQARDGTGYAVMVNCSYEVAKMVTSTASDSWSSWWVVHVKVKFPSGGAAPGATVTIRDAKGTTVFTGITDGNGFIGNVLLLEQVTTGSVKDAYTPHTFNATLGLSTNENSTEIIGPTLVTMEIADNLPPVLTVTSHSNGDHIRTSTLVLKGTAVDAGSSVLRVEARIATQTWQTCSGTESWEWTTSLPGDGTYPISVRARDLALNQVIVYLNLTLDTLPPDIEVTVPPSPANNSLVGTADVSIVGWVDAADVVVTADGVTADMDGTVFTLNLTLVEGVNSIVIRAEDPAGNVATLEWRINADLNAPALTILSPQNGSAYNATTVTMTGTTDPFSDVYYRVVELSTVWSLLTASGSGGFTKELTGLQQGTNTIHVMVRDVAGNEIVTVLEITVDTVPPRLESMDPLDNANVNQPSLTLSGWYNENLSSLMVGDQEAIVNGPNFTVVLDLEEGLNQFAMAAADLLGNVGLYTLRLYLDQTPPGIDLPGFTFDQETGDYKPFDTNQKFYLLLGNTELGSTVFVDKWAYETDSLGRFAVDLELKEGDNPYEVMVRDMAGNEFFTNITLVLDTYAPQLVVTSPEHMSTVSKDYVWVEGTVTQGDTVEVGDVEMVSEDGTFRLKVKLEQAVNRIVVNAYDEAGNHVSAERVVFQGTDTSGLTGNPIMDDNCNAILVVMVIVVVALAIMASYFWRGEDVLDRKERALESVLEDDHIEMDKPHLEPTSGYLQYDPTSATGRKNEFEERDDEEFISMDAFRREMERRE